MARTAHNANWRAMRRFVDVLLANVEAELTADKPADLNVTAPAAANYYVLPNVAAVRAHDANGTVRVYVYPSGDRTRNDRTGGNDTRPSHSSIDITIAVYVLEEAGATDITETWKTLTPPEREMYRVETLLGAMQDVIDSKSRNGDDVLQVNFVTSRVGADEYKRDSGSPGTWGRATWRVTQIIDVPQQNVI